MTTNTAPKTTPNQAQERRIKPVCSHCGSDEIFADACAEWDKDDQKWCIVTVYDNTDCGDCGEERSVDWIEV